MNTRMILVAVGLVLMGAAFMAWPGLARPNEAPASDVNAPEVYASPINGGCYIAAPGQCRLHVDPFTVNIVSGKRLSSIQLRANGVTIYDFRTDVSNPPPASGSTYTPSLVAQDFAAVCGQSYVLNVVGQDTGDSNPLNMGQTAQFTCPSTVP